MLYVSAAIRKPVQMANLQLTPGAAGHSFQAGLLCLGAVLRSWRFPITLTC